MTLPYTSLREEYQCLQSRLIRWGFAAGEIAMNSAASFMANQRIQRRRKSRRCGTPTGVECYRLQHQQSHDK